MKNLFSYPFERNRFFYGKLLTVADFESEQRYFNDKRRFLNKYLFGSGVICGLNTYSIDDSSVMIEAGAAFDSTGREIVVHESTIRKLSGIEGFDKTQSDTLYLAIDYLESATDPVYSVAGASDLSNSSSEYNRTKEGYRLYIVDDDNVQTPQTLFDTLIRTETIYSDKNVTIKQSLPVVIPLSHHFKVVVEVIKHIPDVSVSFDYIMETPYFAASDGGNQIHVKYEDSMAGGSNPFVLQYELAPPDYMPTTAAVSIPRGTFSLSVAGKKQSMERDITFDVRVTDLDFLSMLEKEYFSIAMDAPASSGSEKPVYLAKINIFRSNTSYLIESVKEMPFDQYCYNPQLSLLSDKLEGYLQKKTLPNTMKATVDPEAQSKPEKQPDPANNPVEIFASGVVEIPLGLNPRPKQKFYSEEIMHGLGKGNVSIRLGLQSKDNPLDSVRGSYTVFGSPDVFDGSEYEPAIPAHSLGAITYHDRGTFVVGVKLYETTNLLSVNVRWYAYRDVSFGAAPAAGRDDKCIFIKPDTITIAPREKAYLKVIFYNMDESPCKWWVADENGGTVEANGEYTAPNKAGVYEICVENLANPLLKASAFVVVKEKGVS